MGTNFGTIDTLELLSWDPRTLGVLMAMVEAGPTVVAKMVTQCAVAGQHGSEILAWYQQAKAELESIP